MNLAVDRSEPPIGWLAALPLDRAVAVDLLGLYSSGRSGQSQVEVYPKPLVFDFAANPVFRSGFKANHLAFNGMAGLRPIPLLGAELRHISLWHLSGRPGDEIRPAVMPQSARPIAVSRRRQLRIVSAETVSLLEQ